MVSEAMKAGKGGRPRREHEQVYHAASGGLAASLSLTARRLHDVVKACSGKGKKTGRFASQQALWLRCAWGMGLLGHGKDRRIIAGVGSPHAIDNAQPHIGKRTQRHRMTLAFRPFALLVLVGPGFLLSTRAGKLIERVAQRLEAGMPTMSLAIVPTLVEYWCSPCQCGKLGTSRVAGRVIAQFGKPPRRQPLSRSRKALKDLAVSMRQKKRCSISFS